MRIAVALAMLALHAPPPAHVTVALRSCPDYPQLQISCSHFTTGDIYLNPDEYDPRHPWEWMPTLAHELGHVWDYQHMTDDARARFAALVRKPGSDWWALQPTGLGAPLPPAELFADAYALCAMGSRYRHSVLSYEYRQGLARYLTPEGRLMRPVTVAATCWLLHHAPR